MAVFGFDFQAVYDKIINLKKNVYIVPDGRKVMRTFSDLGTETEIKILFDADNQNLIDVQKKNGWQAIMDNFKKHLGNQ